MNRATRPGQELPVGEQMQPVPQARDGQIGERPHGRADGPQVRAIEPVPSSGPGASAGPESTEGHTLPASTSPAWQSPAAAAPDNPASLLQRLAEQGDPDAQFKLGRMYYLGQGAALNYALALRWFGEAAAQGRPATLVAQMYREGRGVGQDLGQAFQWFMEAAKKGDANGQASVGDMYAAGEGVDQDFAKAVHWLCQSGSRGIRLNFPETPRSNELLQHLENELNQRGNIKHLAITNNQIAASGAQAIAAIIENTHTLEQLNRLPSHINFNYTDLCRQQHTSEWQARTGSQCSRKKNPPSSPGPRIPMPALTIYRVNPGYISWNPWPFPDTRSARFQRRLHRATIRSPFPRRSLPRPAG